MISWTQCMGRTRFLLLLCLSLSGHKRSALLLGHIFQSIFTNTNVWLSLYGVPLKPLSSTSDDETIGPMGKRSKMRTRNKYDPATPAKARKLKFTFESKKGKSQEEPSSSNVQEISELDVPNEQEKGELPDEELVYEQEGNQEQDRLNVE